MRPSRTLTIREGQDGITCAKEEYIKTLEDVVLLMREAIQYYSFFENYQFQRWIDESGREKHDRAVVGVDNCGDRARRCIGEHATLIESIEQKRGKV